MQVSVRVTSVQYHLDIDLSYNLPSLSTASHQGPGKRAQRVPKLATVISVTDYLAARNKKADSVKGFTLPALATSAKRTPSKVIMSPAIISRLASAAYDVDLDTIPVTSSAQVESMLPRSTYRKGRTYKVKTTGVGKRQPVKHLHYDKVAREYVEKTVMRCKEQFRKVSRVVTSKKPEYKDLRSTKFRVKHEHKEIND